MANTQETDEVVKRLKEYGFSEKEKVEISKDHFGYTDYPKSIVKHRFVFQDTNFGVEEIYFWIIKYLQHEADFSHTEKITDTYAAAEASSHFGMLQTRLSAQQNQVSQYLKGISDMVKGLFQIVRELRILDERLQYYIDTYEENENKVSSEIVLKGLWIDLVEGGAKNPGSVYGLAKEVGFVILPDLFFRIQMKDTKEIDEVVDKLKFNKKVKEVLKRKLRQYYEWKTRTYAELKTRRNFEIKYLRQHYDTIILYTSWIKPYLKNISRLQPNQKFDNIPQLVSSFEGAVSEIEIIVKKKEANSKYWSVVLANFFYTVQPKLDYHMQEYQYKGPVHVGKIDLNLRAYSWTDKDIENYKRYRDDENMQILSSIDDSIKAALDSLGDELKKYLMEGGESFEKKEEKSKKTSNKEMIATSLDPFISIFKGFWELFSAFGFNKISFDFSKKEDPFKKSKQKSKAAKGAKSAAFDCYHNYKKAHGLTAW
jgi:hypothetical protein